MSANATLLPCWAFLPFETMNPSVHWVSNILLIFVRSDVKRPTPRGMLNECRTHWVSSTSASLPIGTSVAVPIHGVFVVRTRNMRREHVQLAGSSNSRVLRNRPRLERVRAARDAGLAGVLTTGLCCPSRVFSKERVLCRGSYGRDTTLLLVPPPKQWLRTVSTFPAPALCISCGRRESKIIVQ